jgi:phage-related protein
MVFVVARESGEDKKPAKERKHLRWMGDSRKVLSELPEEVRYAIGTALRWAQEGGKHVSAKPLKGFGDSQVLEVIEDYDSDTYRAVYTVRFTDAIYVLLSKEIKQGRRYAEAGNRACEKEARLG